MMMMMTKMIMMEILELYSKGSERGEWRKGSMLNELKLLLMMMIVAILTIIR